MAEHILELFEKKARAGEGSFAIAYSLLKLVDEQERMATMLGRLGFDGPGSVPAPGALESIGMQLKDLITALEPLSINASVDINNA